MAETATIHACRLFPGDGAPPLIDHVVEITGNSITAIRPATVTDARDRRATQADIVAPGFIDLQINGAGDRQFNHDPTPETLRIMAEAAAKGGTAHILPTFITAPGRDYLLAIAAVRTAIAAGVPGILGLHLEGPFLSPHRPGIHPHTAIRPLTLEDIALIDEAARDIPILLTLAPEALPHGALTALLTAGITVFAGHTEATADDIALAEAQGLRGATHLFNAMSQMVGRAPGVAGAVMASDRWCQTNANQSPLGERGCPLSRAETAPLSESGGAFGLEEGSAGEAAFLVEMVEDGGVDRGEFLQASHAPKPQHRSLSSSERQV